MSSKLQIVITKNGGLSIYSDDLTRNRIIEMQYKMTNEDAIIILVDDYKFDQKSQEILDRVNNGL